MMALRQEQMSEASDVQRTRRKQSGEVLGVRWDRIGIDSLLMYEFAASGVCDFAMTIRPHLTALAQHLSCN
jgi:hypothetical protein